MSQSNILHTILVYNKIFLVLYNIKTNSFRIRSSNRGDRKIVE